MKELWTEKYRPRTVADYVFRDEEQRAQVQAWINSDAIPHLLFSGSPGVGKTTLAKVLINEIGVEEYDVLQINASRDNGVDFIKTKVEGFVQTMPFGDFKVVLLDEADYLSHNAQAIMRGVMETYHASARFILTCNSPNKIIPALHSRCQGFHIEKVDQVEFTARMATVLVTEGVVFELDTLDTYVKATYPDLRKCLNMCQMNSTEGTLVAPHGDEGGIKDWKLGAVDLFKQGRIIDARKLISSSIRSEEAEDAFRWMYDNLDLWAGDDQEKQDRAILAIRDGLVNVPLVADQEILISATLVELTQI